MKRSTKAALFSAFVFPGAGHIFLKRYFLSALLAGPALIALYVLAANAVEQAQGIVDKIMRGEVQPDSVAIAELISRQPAGADAHLINMATIIFVITWLVAIVDSYRVGRLQEND
ncbi:MAG: hypothetical protein V7739_20255 [Motiliproteus sp.]